MGVALSSQHALQDCVSVFGCALRWSGRCACHPWQHPRTCPWICCRRPVVGCPDCPPGPTRPPRGQEASRPPRHPWQHPRTRPWIPCCCPVVGRPDCPSGPTCPPCWQEVCRSIPRRRLCCFLPQLPLLQPGPCGSSWLRQHCRLPRRSQCRCLPRISLLLNIKAAHFVPAERQKDFTMRTSQLVNYVPTKPDKRRDSRYSMFLLRRVLQTTLSE